MDDVTFAKPTGLSNNDILIFDASINKFTQVNFLTVINNIKAELEVQYNKLIDTDGTYTYIGEAVPGTATSSPTWRIKRIEEIGDDYNILWASGTRSQGEHSD